MNQKNILLQLSKQEYFKLIHSLWLDWSCKIEIEYKMKLYQKVSIADLELLQKSLEKNVFYPHKSRLNLFIGANTIPITPFKEILNSLLLKTPIICRIPNSFSLDFYKYLENSLPEHFKDLIQFTQWSSTDIESTKNYIQKSDCVIIHGNDETINLFKTMSASKHFMGFGHKASFIVCKPNLNIIQDIIQDISIFEQKGCLSPQTIYYLEDNLNLVLDFAQKLDSELNKINFNSNLFSIYQKQNFLEKASLSPDNQIIGKNIILSQNSEFEYSFGGGLIWLKPLKDLMSLNSSIQRLNGRIGTIGTNLPESFLKEFICKIRICELGKMQKPDIFWLQEPTHYNLH